VFPVAVVAGAVALVVTHNHPSGDPSPSSADIQVTRSLREASRNLEIQLLDHVIYGEAKADPQNRGSYSFREAGLLRVPVFPAPWRSPPGVSFWPAPPLPVYIDAVSTRIAGLICQKVNRVPDGIGPPF
jgi:hypothetical protein